MSVFKAWGPRSASTGPPNRKGFTQLPHPGETDSPRSVVAEHVERVGKGKGSYEVIEKIVWVGPGRGDLTIEEHASSPKKDECVNPPEAVARGEGFFRKGAVIKVVYKCGVVTIVTLLGIGIACLLCSFCFPGAIDGLLIQAMSSHEESTTPLPLPSPPEPRRPEGDAKASEGEARRHDAEAGEEERSDNSRPELDSSDEFDDEDAKRMRRSLCEDVSKLATKNSTNHGKMRGAKIAGIEEQLDWCCRNERIGCRQFDCDSEWSAWELTWSELKKQWCCEHFSRGCVSAAA